MSVRNIKTNTTGASFFNRHVATVLQAGTVSGVLLLTGCMSLDPQPLERGALQEQVHQDTLTARQNVPAIAGPLTLDEAIARALKYNLDSRSREMEQALAMSQYDVGNFDMLPKMIAAAGYSRRSEYATTRAVDSVTGEPSLANPYISSDKQHATSDLGLTWSVLDFGLSYYEAKQNADRVLIASERRRQAMHVLVQDVRSAFWRAASAQKLQASVKQSTALAESALADARQAETERLRSPVESLRYQRQVLENLRLLEAIEQELGTAKVELAALINAPLGANLTVVEPAETFNKRVLDLPVEQLEAHALEQNALLREQNYNTRIASQETRKTLLRLFPNLSLNYSLRHDSDKYLINNNWNEAGAQLSFNLLNILSAPAQMRLAKAGIAVADQRRVATQMAVLAQVHIARLQYANALQQFQRADAIWQVDDRLNQQTANRAQAQAVGALDTVASNTSAILSQLRRYQAMALANAAASKLQATLGMEPAIGNLNEVPLAQLQQEVHASLAQWNQGQLAAPAVEAGK
ncbi:TolC family protein [Pseudomonas sp. LJDD11]|uniref:TolC family protein n=1 Tax=Pseudomonas sp. LJDD11 TaxID=2931984 RepID=UPI00211BA13D|nr:TolC family protein [Pseudomonas sp. LJDD11]MCQ9426502.1 TolC family protein [Pseudomonas sp. LJDD11]